MVAHLFLLLTNGDSLMVKAREKGLQYAVYGNAKERTGFYHVAAP